ncbi:MAG: pilin [Patescibacteria group bacterium]|nr:pilin [Patescibacteria group bacterium]
MRKKIISLFVISLFLVPFLMASPVGASNDTFGLDFVNGTTGGNGIALGQKDPRTMVAQIINVVLTILGIVAVVIVLLGGFKWMTAGGNEDKVSEAKKLLGAGVIGLVIILAAWGIASFVLNELMKATGN